MDSKNLEHIVKNLFLFLPLFKKKVVKWNLYREDMELSPSHFFALFVLDEAESMTLTELAKSLDISKPNITPIIQKLFEKGYVERIGGLEDRRFIHVRMTVEGRDFIKRHKRLVEENLERKLSSLTAEELNRLEASLENLMDILDKLEQ